MDRQTATVPITFVSDLMAGVSLPRETLAGCIDQVGIVPELLEERGARVTVAQFGAFYRQLAVLLDDETPGFFGRPLRGGTLKFLCLSMLDAPSLQVALYRFTWFFRLLLDDLAFDLARDGDLTRVTLVEHAPLPGSRALVHEIMLKLVHGVSSWMIDRKIPLARVEYGFPCPPGAAEYAYLQPGPVWFDQPATALCFESEILASPIRKTKRDLADFLRDAPADWIHVSIGERMLAHRVREYLEPRLAEPLDIGHVASALHFSVRTLSRRLAAEGTSFQAVKDELRRDVAIQRLTRTDQSIAAIGGAVGFDDPATFNRAFKHWTGSTPGAYRRAV